MLTCPCSVYPLTPHFYIVKLGLTGYTCTLFSNFCLKHRCRYTFEPSQFALNIDCGYRSVLTLDGSKVRRVYDVARERYIGMKFQYSYFLT